MNSPDSCNRLRWKRRLGNMARHWGGAPQRPRAMVLLYHSIGNTPLALPRTQFDQQMQYLQDTVRVLPLEELLADNLQTPACAITFDDGYLSVLESALPVLAIRRLPGTLYVVTGAMGESQNPPSDSFAGLYGGERMLTWAQLRELKTGGVEVGSHLEQHVDLTAVAADTMRSQLENSRRTIEQRMGSGCHHLAYPWGRANRAVAACAREAGYRTAVTGIHGAIPAARDAFLLPRIDIRRDYSVEDFAAILRGDWDYLGLLQRARAAWS